MNIQKYWIFLALFACFITACEIVNIKYLTNNCNNLNTVIPICFVVTGIVASIYLMFNISKIKNMKLNSITIRSIILFSILIIVGKTVIIKSLELSPNIGYTHMIINLNVILTFLFGYLLFKQKINIYGGLGIILCMIGLFIIVKTC